MLLEVDSLQRADGPVDYTCWCDGLLVTKFEEPEGGVSRYYRSVSEIGAMSLVGPEVIIRGMAARCAAENSFMRGILRFRGGGKSVDARWMLPWRPRAVRLEGTLMHLVALPQYEAFPEQEARHPDYVVIAEDEASLVDAIYGRLNHSFTTPLIPINGPGQSEAEREASYQWRDHIVEWVRSRDSRWLPLYNHPALESPTWKAGGILKLMPSQLDKAVCEMVRDGELEIPDSRLAVQLTGGPE